MVIYIINVLVDVENIRESILVLKSREPPAVQMFTLAQDWFPVFPALVRLVIFTAEHVYSGNAGDRFSAQGVISHIKLVIYNWYKAVWVYMKHGVYSKQYSLAKRTDKIGYYLVRMMYVGCFSPKSMVSTWIISYPLVYTWHTQLHYLHAVNAGCVLAGVAPVVHCLVFYPLAENHAHTQNNKWILFSQWNVVPIITNKHLWWSSSTWEHLIYQEDTKYFPV